MRRWPAPPGKQLAELVPAGGTGSPDDPFVIGEIIERDLRFLIERMPVPRDDHIGCLGESMMDER